MTTENVDISVHAGLGRSLRHVLLRILLWSLGVAAVVGVIAVLVDIGRAVKDVMFTALLTAGASLMLLGACLLVERPLTRLAGLVGMVTVVLEYLLILALLWLGFNERVALTTGCIAAACLPAMLFLVVAAIPQARIAGRVGVVSSVAIGALLMGAVWLDGSPWSGERWCNLAASIATFFPIAVLCLVGAGTDHHGWRWVGVAAAIAGCAGMFYLLAWSPHTGQTLFAATVGLAIVVGHANVLMLLPLKRGQRWLRWGTIAATIATAVFIVSVRRLMTKATKPSRR